MKRTKEVKFFTFKFRMQFNFVSLFYAFQSHVIFVCAQDIGAASPSSRFNSFQHFARKHILPTYMHAQHIISTK